MEWSWTVFLIALPISVLFSMFSRGAMNSQNVEKYGEEADYEANPRMAVFGSIAGGTFWAAVITVIIGIL